jgi:hypothetical protein
MEFVKRMYYFNVCVIDKGTNESGFLTSVFRSGNEFFLLPLRNDRYGFIHAVGVTLHKSKGILSNFIQRLAYI